MSASADFAIAETKTLTLYNTHTHEHATITFKRNGSYVASGLRDLNRFLRDWRRNESIKMDPRLFDLIWAVYRQTGTSKPIHVVSGYRAPATNNMLRRRSRGVAKFSQHTLGKAMDFFIPGVASSNIRVIGLRQQVGGVGYYPTSKSKFIHLDTGRVRHWPRMTRSQLVKVFPRGNTLHVPSDGKPLPGYDTALARAKSGKSLAQRSTRVASLTSPTTGQSGSGWDEGVLREKGSGKGFLTALLGGGLDEEEEAGGGVEATSEAPPAPVRAPAPVKAAEPTPVRTAAVQRPGPVPPARVGDKGTAATQVAALTPAVAPVPAAPVATSAPTSLVPEIEAKPAPVSNGASLAKAPLPRAKPLTQVAALKTASDGAIPREKPAAPTVVARADPSTDQTTTAAIPGNKPELNPSTSPAAVLAYASPVPGSKPGSVLDATREFAGTGSELPSPRPSPRPKRGAVADAADGPATTVAQRPNGGSGGEGTDPSVYVEAQPTGTTAFASLYHPDQRSITGLISEPDQVLLNDFAGDTLADMRMDSFTGTAIATLTARHFN